MKIFIAGIPGTGKTTIGDGLERDYGFRHINLEGLSREEFSKNPVAFIKKLANSPGDIVVTWGFMPNEQQTSLVINFKQNGFKIVWFDGNRKAALKEFNRRGGVSEELFNIQLSRIDNYDVIKKIQPLVYDTFQQNGSFKSIEAIIKDLKKALS